MYIYFVYVLDESNCLFLFYIFDRPSRFVWRCCAYTDAQNMAYVQPTISA